VIGGSERFYSIDPTGGTSAWKAAGSLSGSVAVMAALTCNGLKLCIGVGYGNAGAGSAKRVIEPDGRATAWIGSAIGLRPAGSGRRTGRWRQLSGAQLLRGRRRAPRTRTRVRHRWRGGWRRGEASEEASQATISQIACNTKLCVEVDNRGTVTYGVVEGWVERVHRRRRRPPPRRSRRSPDHVDEDADPERHGLTRARVSRVDARRESRDRAARLTPDNLAA